MNMTLGRLAAFAAVLTLAAQAQAATPNDRLYGAYQEDEVFLQLVDPLGVAQRYCLDIAGFPASGDVWSYRESEFTLIVHTCKTGIPKQAIATLDQMISRSALTGKPGRIRYSRLDACLSVLVPTRAQMEDFFKLGLFPPPSPDAPKMSPVMDDSDVYLAKCAETPEQQIVFDADGRVHPVLDPQKCLTVGEQAYKAGEEWRRRFLTFTTCSKAAAPRQVWAAAKP